MRKVLIAFAVGVAVASLGFALFHVEPADRELSASDGSGETAAAPTVPEPNPSPPAGVQRSQDGAGAAPPEQFAESPAPRQSEAVRAEESTEARFRRDLEEAQGVVRRTAAELERLRIEGELAADPIVSPIFLPPEFDWLAENLYRDVFHERMQREPIDAAWAGTMEPELLRFIYRRPDVVQKYGAPTVRCHTTQCEVTFLATGVYDDPSVARADARALFDNSFVELDGMFDCGPGECWAEAIYQDGIVTIFWGMTKDEDQTRSQATVATALRR